MSGTFPACIVLLLVGINTFAQPLRIDNAAHSPTGFSFSFPTLSNRTYGVHWGSLAPPNLWATLTNVQGNGATAAIRDPANQASRKFYRLFAEPPLRYLTVGDV